MDSKSKDGSRKHLIDFLFYSAVLLVYILLSLSAPLLKRQNALISVLGTVIPIGWLLVATLFCIKKQNLNLFFFYGQVRTVLLIGIAAGVVLAVVLLSLLWPGGNRRVTAITLLSYLLIILVVPVAEELFFRGLLLSHLKETMGVAASIAIITLLFGLVHVHQGLLFEMALLSLVLCITAFLSRTVVSCIVLHAGWNTLSILNQGPPLQMKWLLTISAVVSVILIVYVNLLIQRRANG